MPRGIIQDKEVTGAFERDVLIGVIQEDLEDFRIGMAKFERIEFPRSWQNGSRDIHPEMRSTVGLNDLVSFRCEAPSGTGIAFDTALVEKPKVNTLIAQPFPNQFDEGFSPLLVLAVRPRPGDFQAKPFIMKPPHERAVACLQLTVLGEVSMKLPSSPVSLVDMFRM
jgi:hypothetical protein